ncbi:class I SAM-dependent methyltransferase [Novosphingobium album (ex Hu et al. 2023)]|uniref:Class I SAM-dependent methyltransferase n=1 Tax=Novosphingobium album (ex Hu et al. 2023) TaxID=2930093 RepID=A0ABT0B151_9SPHN|nr:class I SAM-dependent methyltransferase [Novosphingobium album (ex Hu et al. 2023)]MCJ2178608.1 class I SAM-dependent methyltransferase [Novosphingobium album (ex Hu et al. 2023)]
MFAIYDFHDMKRLGLPWWTFSAISAVDRYLTSGPRKRVFEYGSGASTLWLAQRCDEVVSIETDPKWYANLSKELTAYSNVRLRLIEAQQDGTITSHKAGFEELYFDNFVHSINDETKPFDVVIIDGRAREACLQACIPHLTEGGIIVIDDTNRQRYRNAIDASGMPARRFDGRAVSLPLPDSTTLLARHTAVLSVL